MRENIQRHFSRAFLVPIGPNPVNFRNYVEMRLSGEVEPGTIDKELQANIVGIILEKIPDMCVEAVVVSILLAMNPY